jgi:hypothetical protein
MHEDGWMSNSFVGAAARAADFARATLLAAWPKSGASYEVARLVEEGYAKGEPCDLAFSVSLADPSRASDAAASARVAGYSVDTSQLSRGFITVQTGVELRTFDIAQAVARLERLMGAYEGFVAVIGPVQSPRSGVRVPVVTEDDDRALDGDRAVA